MDGWTSDSYIISLGWWVAAVMIYNTFIWLYFTLTLTYHFAFITFKQKAMLEYIIHLEQHNYFFAVCWVFPLYNFEGYVIKNKFI